MLKATELTISGCKVKFPAKPYRSQVAMMSKIITSIQRSQNSLLESPTGSGKSLALLCASLAWQETETARVDAFNTLRQKVIETQDPAILDTLMAMAGPGVDLDEEEMIFPAIHDPANDTVTQQKDTAKELKDTGGGFFADPEMDDFVDSGSNPKKSVPKEDSISYHLPGGDIQMAAAGINSLRVPKKQSVPKIYFGTRTHKQVAQIVRELKKTGYSGVRMTILASREHTCIHPTVSKSYNKNQDCQDLCDKKKGGGCRYQFNVKTKLSSYYSLRYQLGHDKAWDLEEIVKIGKKGKFCPYYGVRELRKEAQLIICPYNYLVDPKIRKSMEINLENQILMLDEAHNIEDSARDSVSGSFDIEDIVFAMQDCERMVGLKVLTSTHTGLADFCSRLAQWVKKSADGKADYSDYNSQSRVWTGTVGLAEWNELVFPPSNFVSIKSMLDEAIKEQELAAQDHEEGLEESLTPSLNKKASDVLTDIFRILDFMYLRESIYRDDYRMAVVQSTARKKTAGTGWVKKGAATALVKVLHLHFWCLNPAVCFDELKNTCRSIVLTSGTLSPIVTFASELDVKFPVTLEADHVIDKKQVWVGTLSHGPSGHNLNATYKNTETLTFQDEVGRLVRDVCFRVPHGILLFLPSYKMLDNLVNRWQTTGNWADIMTKKAIVCEPRYSDKLDEVMKEFYDAIAMNTSYGDIAGQNGALFLAVCRGKVSEGLDFADNNARAVICVGIPYPNVKDSLVDLKRRYNDHKRNTRDPNILSGAEWYEIQAFRALNQALGRCIRHKKDWGAILMVDDRYGKNEKYVQGLSKWVRKNVGHFRSCDNMFNHLERFIQDMNQMDKEERELQAQMEASLAISKEEEATKAEESTKIVDVEDDTASSYVSTGWRKDKKIEAVSLSHFSLDTNPKATLAAKLAKLQEFSRYVPNKFGSQFKCNVDATSSSACLDSSKHLNLDSSKPVNLDASTHLNKGGEHLNGTSSLSQVSVGSTDEIRTKTRNRKERKPRKPRNRDKNSVNPKESFTLEENTNVQSKRKFLNSNSSEDKTPNKAPRVNDDSVVEVEDIEMDVVELEDSKPKVNDVIVVSSDDEITIIKAKEDFKHNKDIVSQAIFQDDDDQFDDDAQDDLDLLMIPPQESINSTKPKTELELKMADSKSTSNSNHIHKNAQLSDSYSNEMVKKVQEPNRKDLEQKSSNQKNQPKKSESSVVNISASDLLKTNLDEIVSEDSRTNSHWSKLIMKRKEKKDANKSVVPETPEKDNTFDDTALDWDDDMFQLSDEENTPDVNVNNSKPSSSNKVESKKSLFDSKSMKNPTEKGEMDKTTSSIDTSIRSDCKSPGEYLESTDTSFNKTKSVKKSGGGKKRRSKDSVLAKMSKLPICQDSDDDFQ